MTLSIRHILVICAAALCLSLLPSCNKAGEFEAGTADVSFSVTIPQRMATRAISDGLGAVDLYFRVYRITDAGAVFLPALSRNIPNAFSGLTATLSTTLVEGETYSFVFWAQSPYAAEAFGLASLDSTVPFVSVDYSSMKNSDDSFDAFYACLADYSPASGASMDVVLTRPFAQINFGTTAADWSDAYNSGARLNLTSMTYKDAYTRLYPFTGEVANPVQVTFKAAEMPGVPLEVNDYNYKWLSMDYVLVPADKTLTDVSLSLVNSDRTTISVSATNVPVQRNFRTNLLGGGGASGHGGMITSPTTVVLVLDSAYIDEYNINY